jgi:hypothetical protein
MSRGKLDKATGNKIGSELPDVTELRTGTLGLQPDFISMGFPPESRIPIAAVCLQDVTSVLQEVRHALFEALAYILWYRKRNEPPNDHLAAFFGRFYLDDAALRLYAAGEHLAEAIVCMLELDKERLRKYRKTGRPDDQGSQQSAVGKFLKSEMPGHPITTAISVLIDSKEWLPTIKYRDVWVHRKPPIIAGMGISYERRNRLKVSNTGVWVSFGGGDAPEYTVDQLIALVRPAAIEFTKAVTVVVEYYIRLLQREGKTTLIE